jgi:NAD(P) transhydrogenase subunit beta
MLSANLSAIFYLISGVLFILALRGLSSPETSRQGNFFGILGMAIAVTVTFLSIGNFSTGFVVVLIFLLIGGLIGAFIAYKIPMTAMPELVAGFHSLVGLAAVFVAISLAAVNIFGGFLVTQRMLAMYKKKKKDK